MGRGPWPWSADAAEGLSSSVIRAPSGRQRRQDRNSGRQVLGDGAVSGEDREQGVPGGGCRDDDRKGQGTGESSVWMLK